MAKKLFFVAFLLGLPAFAGAQTLTEKSVKDLIARVEKATANKDVDTIAKHMSDRVVIDVTITSRGNKAQTKLGKAEYVTALRDTWSMATMYVYRRSNENIVITNNVATVTADVVENMVINGQQMRGKSQETATIELVNGIPLVTKITAYVAMQGL